MGGSSEWACPLGLRVHTSVTAEINSSFHLYILQLSVCVMTCVAQVGTCECHPGYRGARCQLPCEGGYYGAGCESVCACEVGIGCDFVTGFCLYNCSAGWMGNGCDKRESLAVAASRCESLRVTASLRVAAGHCGSLWVALNDCESLRVAVGH